MKTNINKKNNSVSNDLDDGSISKNIFFGESFSCLFFINDVYIVCVCLCFIYLYSIIFMSW